MLKIGCNLVSPLPNWFPSLVSQHLTNIHNNRVTRFLDILPYQKGRSPPPTVGHFRSIYCSPLLRALQTAHFALSDQDGWGSIKLLKEVAEKISRSRISINLFEVMNIMVG